MQLHVNPSHQVPVYRQIVRQVLNDVAGGRLSPGARLPARSELAERLVISPRTVDKAYAELVDRGLITCRSTGCFVKEMNAEGISATEQASHLRELAKELVTEAHVVGSTLDSVCRLVGEVFEELLSGGDTRGRNTSGNNTSDLNEERKGVES